MTRVSDAPVARTTDPITSYISGEDPDAREASEREVYDILANTDQAMSDHRIYQAHEIASVFMDAPQYTAQRLRTARAQLVKKGLVVEAGRAENASPTGRSAMTWAVA